MSECSHGLCWCYVSSTSTGCWSTPALPINVAVEYAVLGTW